MKIAFTCDWGESPADILSRYSNQTPGKTGTWKQLQGVDNVALADIVIVLGGTNLEIDRDRALLIVREPDFIRSTNTYEFPHAMTWHEGHCGVTWWLSKSFDELCSMPMPEKTKLASSIVSAKHDNRNEALKKLLLPDKVSGLFKRQGKVELFGRGHETSTFGSIYQGPIEGNGNCKYPGLGPYKYSLVLENSAQQNYWTEKLADAILSWTFPIYWGCPNVHDFFDPAAVICIDDTGEYAEVAKILDQSITPIMIQALSESRRKILYEYNIWELIYKQINIQFGFS